MSSAAAAGPAASSPYTPKIAFCFLVYDRILQPEIWNTWFKQIQDQAVVLIHSSEPYVHMLPDIHVEVIPRIETAWGKISIVEAQIAAFDAALRHHTVAKIVLLSGSTIPVKDPKATLQALLADPKSHIQFSNLTQVFPRYDCLLKFYPRDKIRKHSQWVILNRLHASHLVSFKKDILRTFADAPIPDEVAIGTALAAMGYLDSRMMELRQPMLTSVDWDRGDPYTYDTISDQDIERLVFDAPRIFFARKFKADTRVVVPDHDGHSLYEYMHDLLGVV